MIYKYMCDLQVHVFMYTQFWVLFMEKKEWTSLHSIVIRGLRRGGFTMHQFHAAVVIGFVALALVLDDPLYVLLPHRLALGSQ